MTAITWTLCAALATAAPGSGDMRLDKAIRLYDDFQPELAVPLLQTVAADTSAPAPIRAKADLYLGLCQAVQGDDVDASFREAFRLAPTLPLPPGTPDATAAAAEKIRAEAKAEAAKRVDDALAALKRVEFPKVDGHIACRPPRDADKERVFVSPVIATGAMTEADSVAKLKAAAGEVGVATVIIGGVDGFAVAVAVGDEPGLAARVEPFRSKCKAVIERPPPPPAPPPVAVAHGVPAPTPVVRTPPPVTVAQPPPAPVAPPAVADGVPPPDPSFAAARVNPQGVLELATQPQWEELPAEERRRAIDRAWAAWSKQTGEADGLIVVHSRDAQTLYRAQPNGSSQLESWGPKPSLPPSTHTLFASGGGSLSMPIDASTIGFTAYFAMGTYLFDHTWDVSVNGTLAMYLQGTTLGMTANVTGGVRRHWLLVEKIDLNVGAQAGYGFELIGSGASGPTVGALGGVGYVLSMDPFQTIDLYMQAGLAAGSPAFVTGVGFTNTF